MEKRIAIIGAIKDEIAGIKKEMRITNTLHWPTGNAFVGEWQGRTIVLIRSGMGCDRARRALAEMAKKFELEQVISIGYAGALDPALKVGDLVVADQVVYHETMNNYSLDKELLSMMPEARRWTLLTVDSRASKPQEKKAFVVKDSARAADR